MQERQTKQKTIIYEALKTLDHPTATEVYGYVRERYPTLSRATVFRVLGGFAENGRALELRAAGDEVRYDFNVQPHCHVRCEGCGRVADVQMPSLDGEFCATADHGFLIRGYRLEFFGLCKACRKELKN